MLESQNELQGVLSQINEITERKLVVEEALSWERTPYHHMARVKGEKGGVDCAMLLGCVYENCKLIEPLPVEHYSEQWHMHSNVELFKATIARYARAVRSEVKPGDIMLFQLGRVYSHGAIVLDGALCLHASLADRMVVRVDIDRDPHLSRCSRELWRINSWGD